MSELQSTKHNAVLKTVGRQTARLLTALSSISVPENSKPYAPPYMIR